MTRDDRDNTVELDVDYNLLALSPTDDIVLDELAQRLVHLVRVHAQLDEDVDATDHYWLHITRSAD